MASTVTTETTTTTTQNLMTKMKNLGILILGAGILALHVVLFYGNVMLFNVFMCIYIICFASAVTIVLYNNQSCFIHSPRTFNTLTYLSMYTIFLEFVMIIVAISFAIYKATTKK